MSSLQVSSNAVQAAATMTAAKVAEFDQRVGALDSLVSAVVGGEWIGGGAEAFRAEYAEWVNGAREVHDALSRIASLLASTSVEYETTENTVTRGNSSSSVSTGIAGS